MRVYLKIAAFVGFQAVLAAALCWFLWRAGRPEPGAPRRRRGNSLKGSTATRSLGGRPECADRAQHEPGAGSPAGWSRMLRPWLAISLAILVAGAVLGTAPLLRNSPSVDETLQFLSPRAALAALSAARVAHELQFLGSLYATLAAVPVLRMARRRDRPPYARELKVVTYILGAIAAPAVIILPLLAALDLGCLPPLVVQLADQWWSVAMACLPVYCLALDGWLAWWIKWRTAKPDPDAPRCPRCGYSLKGSQGLGCPECGLNRSDDRPRPQSVMQTRARGAAAECGRNSTGGQSGGARATGQPRKARCSNFG